MTSATPTSGRSRILDGCSARRGQHDCGPGQHGNEQNSHVDAIFNADQRQVDVVVLVGHFVPGLKSASMPFYCEPALVVLARESAVDLVTAVSCDAVTSIEAIGQHLHERGYRRPGSRPGPKTLSRVLGRMQHF